jgi:CRISPR type III-B/RAMP module-associated protein Cmr3
MSTRYLLVEPLDTIMVRDGRRFDAGASGRAASTSPPPSTFGGALHTALGDPVDEILGAVVQTPHGSLFPVPADIVRHEHADRRLRVEPRDGSEVWDLDDEYPLSHLLAGDGEPPPQSWITADGLRSWLRAEPPLRPGEKLGRGAGLSAPPWRPEQRLGLALRWDGELAGTASPGLLYAMSHLRPDDGTRFLIPFLHGADVRVDRDLLRLGGRGRLAMAELVEPDDDVIPDHPDDFPGGRVAVYLATPALFGTDSDEPGSGTDLWWAPDGARLCALASSGPIPVATASDRAGRYAASRQLTWAAPAGTVFYVDFGDPAAAMSWARRHHGRRLPGVSNSPLRTAGFGMCLTGSW